MKCELCGKKINEYGKYSAVIGKTEVSLCCWCYKKIKKGNGIGVLWPESSPYR